MLPSLYAMILNARFLMVGLAITLCSSAIILFVKLLPRDHPSRAYITGRVTEGRSRCHVATRAPRKTTVPKGRTRITRPERVFAASMWAFLLLDFFGVELDTHLTGHNWLVLWPGTFGL